MLATAGPGGPRPTPSGRADVRGAAGRLAGAPPAVRRAAGRRSGTPGWPGTWPRCGPARSPWRSCHDRRQERRAADRRAAGRPSRARAAGGRGRRPAAGLAVRRQPADPGCRRGDRGLRRRAADRAASGHWDAYGALQLPLVFEAAAAAAIAATTASPFGEPERVAGRWLPFLRLAAAVALTALAAGLLAAAGDRRAPGRRPLDVLRNVAGITGLGLLCAAVLGGGLAWTGPVAYLLAGVYALYTQWHPPGADHAVAVAGPAAARPRRGAVRRAGVPGRPGRHHGARRPRPGRRVGARRARLSAAVRIVGRTAQARAGPARAGRASDGPR